MTWTGPRCPHCDRRMSTWVRVCCDCADGTKSVAGQTENSEQAGRMEGGRGAGNTPTTDRTSSTERQVQP